MTSLPRPIQYAAAGLLTATAVAGCRTTDPSTTEPAPPAPATRAATQAPGTASVDQEEMVKDEQSAVAAVDRFWRGHFADAFGQAYRSPRVEGSYIGTDGPPCAGQPSVPYNAFYCLPGDFLAWDNNLMAAGFTQIGDSWVYLIIAHEWGHAIQARLRDDRVSVAAELQADCLAGAALAGAAQDGSLVFEPGDSEELARTLAAVADDYPWTKESDHGSAAQRTAAFNAGTSGGISACIS